MSPSRPLWIGFKGRLFNCCQFSTAVLICPERSANQIQVNSRGVVPTPQRNRGRETSPLAESLIKWGEYQGPVRSSVAPLASAAGRYSKRSTENDAAQLYSYKTPSFAGFFQAACPCHPRFDGIRWILRYGEKLYIRCSFCAKGVFEKKI